MATTTNATRNLIFCDIDGTIAHYPDILTTLGKIIPSPESTTGIAFEDKESGQRYDILAFPPSSTGLQGYISVHTLELIRDLRRQGHVFVIISGARYSTIMERLPYLPQADAYVVENGGRIFLTDSRALTALPASEDMKWRETHNEVAGSVHEVSKPIAERQGPLWDVYRSLKDGQWPVDARSYTTEFRVKATPSLGKTEEMLCEALGKLPSTMTSSYNLGSADVYPATSGKDLAAAYLMKHFDVATDRSFCMWVLTHKRSLYK
ncbi:hypothetical protein CYMTET_42374 [Cymbomonas tetramitiformis]|uniref:Uncharacterized protein n=1 Tax=Cymbomonas tetramitiformis TaxID=36881 RepID=A0AAE0C5Z0_9CHLO|nr:hypothetical protein CYMTET_42374 [Cymbomonas tetramitiformis]